nr:MAG TPA: hypothetical protein [Microviridae sp.]
MLFTRRLAQSIRIVRLVLARILVSGPFCCVRERSPGSIWLVTLCAPFAVLPRTAGSD